MTAQPTADVAVSVVLATDETPDENDVVAGWEGFAIFIGLVLALVVILWSFTRQLKKAERARQHGVYGPVEDEQPDDTPADGSEDSPRRQEGEASWSAWISFSGSAWPR